MKQSWSADFSIHCINQMGCEDPYNIAQKESKDKMIKVIKQNPWQNETPASRWLQMVRIPTKKISMFKLCSEEYFQTKPVLNFAWGGSTHAEALGLKASFSMSLARTRALLKWIYKLKCTIHIWERSEKCVFSLQLYVDYPEPSHAQHSTARSRSTLHLSPSRCRGALLCPAPRSNSSAPATPLVAPVPAQAHLFVTYDVTHTL